MGFSFFLSLLHATGVRPDDVGVTDVFLTFVALMSIYWGALWNTTKYVHNVKGWIIVREALLHFPQLPLLIL